MTKQQANLIIDNVFAKFVGMDSTKEFLRNWILQGLYDDGFLRPLLIVGCAGSGKSKVLQAIKELNRSILGRGSIFFAGGESIGNRTMFMEDVAPLIQDKSRLLIVDEVHTLKEQTEKMFLELIQPTAERAITESKWKDMVLTWNPMINCMVCATNRLDDLSAAFISRFKVLNIPLYSDDEMEQILHLGLKDSGIIFNQNSLKLVAQLNRGTARDVVHWIEGVKGICAVAGKKTINKSDIAHLIKINGVYPLGINAAELQTLLALESCGELQLKELAARNIVSTQEQNANEKYLLQRGLISIATKRKLTKDGREYLIELRKDGFIK